MNVAAVILDFDGVVVDSLKLHLEAWVIATKELLGIKLENPERFIGLASMSIAESITLELKMPDKKEVLRKKKYQHMKLNQKPPPLLPGFIEAATFLTNKNIPFGIASNAHKSFIIDTLMHWHIELPLIVTPEFGVRPKPEPDVFLKCANDLNVPFLDHKNVLVFEDSVHGLIAAKRAGMVPIGVTTQHSQEILLQNGASYVVKDLSKVLTMDLSVRAGQSS